MARDRRERTVRTEERILRAAAQLFAERGFLDTTMSAIAAEAGVAVQTLYLRFGSKVAILTAAHDAAVVGDTASTPLLERQWVADLGEEPDGRAAVELLMSHVRQMAERVGPVYRVVQAAAADPDVRELDDRLQAQRYTTTRTWAEQLGRKDGFAPASIDEAADLLYAFTSPDFFRVLVSERHWSPDRWEAWVARTVADLLFPPSA